MGMNELFQKQCREQREQLEKSLADMVTVISKIEIGVKQYPENTEIELANLYRGLLRDAKLTKETCGRKIAELNERIDQLK